MTMPKVLLAPNEQIPFNSHYLKWPLLGSRKFDGTRNVLIGGVSYTRSIKVQSNVRLPLHLKEITDYATKENFVFDGELWSPKLTFTELQSVLRSHNAPIPDHVGYYVFDAMTEAQWYHGPDERYEQRNQLLKDILGKMNFLRVFHVEQVPVNSPLEAEDLFNDYLVEGFEGLMLRSPSGHYKHGRATHNEGNIFKFKLFETSDAQIIDVIEMSKMKEEVRHGKRELDVQGHVKRSHKKEDYELADTLGSLVVRTQDGVVTNLNLGRRTHTERKKLWEDHKQGKLVGHWVEFSWMPYGTKDRPRFGKLERFRPDLDGEKNPHAKETSSS